MTSRSRTRIVIPANNESAAIGRVVSVAVEYSPVIVVDDASTDDTARIAAMAGATVLRMPRKSGQGAALRVGIAHALETRAERVVLMDGDGQHNPVETSRFLEWHDATDCDLLIGRRTFSQMPGFRRHLNRVSTWAYGAAAGYRIEDVQCGFRLLGPRLLPLYVLARSNGFGYALEMINLAAEAGMMIDSVPIETHYAPEIASHRRTPRDVWDMLVLTLRPRVRGGRRARTRQTAASPRPVVKVARSSVAD